MLATTAWVIKTWFKITIALAAGVGAVWLFADRPGYVTAAIILAILAEIWVIRALCREWLYEARLFCWWWPK